MSLDNTVKNGALPVTPEMVVTTLGSSYVFVGDSITYGQYLSSPTTECFQAIFSALSFCRGERTINVGVPGWTLANITSDYATHVQPHRPTANGGDGGTVAYLVLMIGINDAFTGRTGSEMVSDVTAYIAQAQSDGFTVVLATILPSTNDPASYTSQQFYNEAIRAGLVPYDLLWDANSVLADPTNSSIYSDGIHPTAPAHVRLAYSLQFAFVVQGGAVGAPALYCTDINTVGNINAGQQITVGENSSDPSYLTLSQQGVNNSSLALFTGPNMVEGFANVGCYNGSLYLSSDAQNPLFLAALDPEGGITQQSHVLIGTTSDDNQNLVQANGTIAANCFASPPGNGYPDTPGLFVGNPTSPTYFGYNGSLQTPAGCAVQDDGNGNLTLEAVSSTNLINIGVNRGTPVQIGAGLTVYGETSVAGGLYASGVLVVDAGARLYIPNGTPGGPTSSGYKSQCAYDNDYFYICTATDTWTRVPLSTW